MLDLLKNFHYIVLVDFFELMSLLNTCFLAQVENHGSFRVNLLEDRRLIDDGFETKLSILEYQHLFLQFYILYLI